MISRITLIVLLLVTSTFVNAKSSLEEGIQSLQTLWAIANYDTTEDKQDKAFTDLTEQARLLTEAYPDKAQTYVWQAIITSTHAGVSGGFSALGKVKEARRLLEKAESIDANVLNGSIFTTLGSLYYQVPGWPLGFGNNKKAEQYLQKALTANPDGIDSNYFYGDFLMEQNHYKDAIKYLEKSLRAADRPNRPLADKGRRQEATTKLKEAREIAADRES